jgi:hypothetical protein
MFRNRLALQKSLPAFEEKSACSLCPCKKECGALGEFMGDGGGEATEDEDMLAKIRRLEFDDGSVFRYLWGEIEREEEAEEIQPMECEVVSFEGMVFHALTRAHTLSSGDYIEVLDPDLSLLCRGRVVEDDNPLLVRVFEEIKILERVVVTKERNRRFFNTMRAHFLGRGVIKKERPRGVESPVPPEFRAEFYKLNADQQRALVLFIEPESYSLIHGMPGTRKRCGE